MEFPFLRSMLSLWLVISSITLTAQGESRARPNVLFIAVDDMRPEMASYGGRALTPHMDRLAASGLQFDRAYCNQSVCGASRVSLMTGLYPEYTQERTYHVTDWRKRWHDVTTLNQHFKNNGYTTVGVGKIYHGSRGRGVDPENWTQWIIPDAGTEYANPDNTKLKLENQKKTDGKRRGPSTEAYVTSDETHFDGQRAAIGAEQIRTLSQKDEPFFVAVGFTKPHLPFVAPQKYWDLYSEQTCTLPLNTGKPPGYPDYASNKNAGELRSYSDIPQGVPPQDFPETLNQRLIHGYLACVSYTDRNIGVLLDALETAGVVDNTIVVLWADHGWKLGDHTSWCKHTNFECDNRVPLMIRYPKMSKTRGRTQSLTELIDLFPTLCDLCDLDKPSHLQGKSLLPVLKNPKLTHRAFAYSSYPHGRGQGLQGVTGHSIRTRQYRYTEWWEKGSDSVVESILTDIESDPGELTRVTDQQQLEQMLSALVKERVLDVRKP
jgi:iduronate 2-sulfatase